MINYCYEIKEPLLALRYIDLYEKVHKGSDVWCSTPIINFATAAGKEELEIEIEKLKGILEDRERFKRIGLTV